MPPRGSILVVDDSAEIRELVQLTLESAGYRVRTAEDGAAALDIIYGDTFSVILFDIQMPVMDGVDFVHAYRSLPGHQARLLVMTAGHNARRYAGQLGADGHIAKPFDPDKLLSTVSAFVGGTGRSMS
jgi:two-component system, chemotaxis family, chemotaxis protein CheY